MHGAEHEGHADQREDIAQPAIGHPLGQALARHERPEMQAEPDPQEQERREAVAHRHQEPEIVDRGAAPPGPEPFAEADPEDRMAQRLGEAVMEDLGAGPAGDRVIGDVLDHEADQAVRQRDLPDQQRHGDQHDQHRPFVAQLPGHPVPADQRELEDRREARRRGHRHQRHQRRGPGMDHLAEEPAAIDVIEIGDADRAEQAVDDRMLGEALRPVQAHPGVLPGMGDRLHDMVEQVVERRLAGQELEHHQRHVEGEADDEGLEEPLVAAAVADQHPGDHVAADLRDRGIDDEDDAPDALGMDHRDRHPGHMGQHADVERHQPVGAVAQEGLDQRDEEDDQQRGIGRDPERAEPEGRRDHQAEHEDRHHDRGPNPEQLRSRRQPVGLLGAPERPARGLTAAGHGTVRHLGGLKNHLRDPGTGEASPGRTAPAALGGNPRPAGMPPGARRIRNMCSAV